MATVLSSQERSLSLLLKPAAAFLTFVAKIGLNLRLSTELLVGLSLRTYFTQNGTFLA